ncbi:MAG TPA: hypothetical protein VLF15_06010, partial [Pseudoxanthomonas sp.]|nr:hypothetical protein [Pseudoxanthomonas sp.]
MKPLLLIVLLSLSMSACTRAPTAPAATPPADANTETPPQGTAAGATELGNYHWRLTSAADAEGKRIDT